MNFEIVDKFQRKKRMCIIERVEGFGVPTHNGYVESKPKEIKIEERL